MKTTKTAAVDIPKFRYVDDITRFLKQMESEVDETSRLVKQQQKLLARVLLTTAPSVTAAMIFDVTPTDHNDQMKTIRKLRKKIDPDLSNIVVPNIKKLQSQYNVAEDLYEKLKTVESVETQLSLQFPNRRGEAYEAAIAAIRNMKTKLQETLKGCMEFLSSVANKHVPKQFTSYVKAIAELIDEHVIFGQAHSFTYASVDPDGNLVFTNYLMLQDAVNDEGDVTPHLYISIQWCLYPDEPTLTVSLNHEYEVPNKLIGEGTEVSTVGEAINAIRELLDLENFSSALGVVPLALQLKVDPQRLNPEMFSYRDFIAKVSVDENTISFVLRKEADTPEMVQEIGAQLYKELKELMKSKNIRLTMRLGHEGKSKMLTFNMVKVAEGGEFNTYDLEFLRDRFGLTNQALKKIALIVNKESSKAPPKSVHSPTDIHDVAERGEKETQHRVRESLRQRQVKDED